MDAFIVFLSGSRYARIMKNITTLNLHTDGYKLSMRKCLAPPFMYVR